GCRARCRGERECVGARRGVLREENPGERQGNFVWLKLQGLRKVCADGAGRAAGAGNLHAASEAIHRLRFKKEGRQIAATNCLRSWSCNQLDSRGGGN